MGTQRGRGDTEVNDSETTKDGDRTYGTPTAKPVVDVSVSGHMLDAGPAIDARPQRELDAVRSQFKSFEDILRYSMLLNKFSTRDLADRSDTSQSSISKSLHGFAPPLGHMQRWIRAMKIDEPAMREEFIKLGKMARFQVKKDVGPLFKEIQAEMREKEQDLVEMAIVVKGLFADPAALQKGIAQKDRRILHAIDSLAKSADAIIEQYSRR